MKQRILVLTFILIFICINQCSRADTVQNNSGSAQTSVQNINYENCYKMYKLDKENLFYQTLAAINSNNFTIDEIQTYNGYIMFTAVKKKYIATVAGIDKSNSMLKITPCNNLYYFQPGIITNIFKYIDVNNSL